MSNQRLISDGSRPIFGDLDRIRGYQMTSNGSHTIQIREESWVPWLSYLYQWNAAALKRRADLAADREIDAQRFTVYQELNR